MDRIGLDSYSRDRDVNLRNHVAQEMADRKEFSATEVGLTHPDLNSFLRMNDKGDIEIFASPGVGIVISAVSKSISFFADTVRVHTREDGFRWNSYRFNYAASTYVEPTLVSLRSKDLHTAVNGIYHYADSLNEIEEEDVQKPITIDHDYGFGNSEQQTEQNLESNIDYSDLSFEHVALLEAYLTDYSADHIRQMIDYIRDGMSFEQAHEKALRESDV